MPSTRQQVLPEPPAKPEPLAKGVFLLIETPRLRIMLGNSVAAVLISITSAFGGAALVKSVGLAALLKHLGL
jgi:hypothetical protein